MESKTVERLLKLNLHFYEKFARAFSSTRSRYGSEIEHILPHLKDRTEILDLGCGNGRVLRLLEKTGLIDRYVGIDSSSELIGIAQERLNEPGPSRNIDSQFICLDIADEAWIETLYNRLGERQTFQAVLLLAVLHHIPTRYLRAQIISQCADLLAPEGLLIVSNWQFLNNDRMKRKIVDPEVAGFSKEELDTDDYFLDWKREGYGIRYCHLIKREKIIQAGDEAHLKEVATFHAGGREGNLSEFVILGRMPE